MHHVKIITQCYIFLYDSCFDIVMRYSSRDVGKLSKKTSKFRFYYILIFHSLFR